MLPYTLVKLFDSVGGFWPKGATMCATVKGASIYMTMHNDTITVGAPGNRSAFKVLDGATGAAPRRRTRWSLLREFTNGG